MRQRHLKINAQGRQIQESRRNFNVPLTERALDKEAFPVPITLGTNYTILTPSFNRIRSLFSYVKGKVIRSSGL